MKRNKMSERLLFAEPFHNRKFFTRGTYEVTSKFITKEDINESVRPHNREILLFIVQE